MSAARGLLLVVGLLAAAPAASAAGGVRRYALVVGANLGFERAPLRYAFTDADRFAAVMRELGGVAEGDLLLLRQPGARELERGLEALRAKAAAAAEQRRSEVFFYYSGHADENGLLLGKERFGYQTLRERLETVRSDVRIAVLDACASGAITRMKGGERKKAFLEDAASSTRGHAFLTSSSADESAQESERIKGSFFTHYLISGLRGAADMSGEGTVTLSEAYQFAFQETLGRTVQTRGGPQHPTYDIELAGTGDVVITDLRQTSAALALDEDVDGRCFVFDAEQRLVVELRKPSGRRVELGLAPGPYEIRCQDDKGARVTRCRLDEGGQVALRARDFQPGKLDPTLQRGGPPLQGATQWQLWKRHRLEFRGGFHQKEGGTRPPTGSALADGEGMVTFGYNYWFARNLVGTLEFLDLDGYALSSPAVARADDVSAFQIGVRRDFVETSRFRPFAALSVGPWMGSTDVASPAGASSRSETAVGGQVAVGFDVQLARWVTLGGRFGFSAVSDFSEPIGGRSNYSGFYGTFGFGWVFGKGR
jgi:hypothetical protein